MGGHPVLRLRFILLSDLTSNVTYLLMNVNRNLRSPLQRAIIHSALISIRITLRDATHRVFHNLARLTTKSVRSLRSIHIVGQGQGLCRLIVRGSKISTALRSLQARATRNNVRMQPFLRRNLAGLGVIRRSRPRPQPIHDLRILIGSNLSRL